MAINYLSKDGLEYLVGKLKALIPTKTSDLTNDSGFVTSASANVPYLRCETAAATAAKTTTLISGSFDSSDLVTGAQVVVEFTHANGVANPTLSINGTTAKSIKRYGTTAPGTANNSSWMAGAIVRCIYDGTYWVLEGWLNTTYSSMSVAEIEAGTATSARLITPARLKTAVETWGSGKTTVTTYTLTSSGWSSKQYTGLQTTYPAADYDLEIEPNGDSCTAAQLAAWSAAQMVGSATTNVLKCMGTQPTVNIPIIVKVTPK